MDDAYLTLNRAAWDERAPAHAASPDYSLARFDDPAYLSDTVAFDRPRLGSLRGLHGVHLQCHIGTDTVSLARLGATMHGLDFSSASIVEARQLSERAGTAVTFHEGDVYDAVAVMGEARFDFVYTGIGALCWLPVRPFPTAGSRMSDYDNQRAVSGNGRPPVVRTIRPALLPRVQQSQLLIVATA